MDWWAGMNPCAGADLNQIEAGIFDPWINCDDLDLSQILHQASTGVTGVTSATPSAAQTILSHHPLTIATTLAASTAPSSDQQQPQQLPLGQHQQHQQSHAFLALAANNHSDSTALPTPHATNTNSHHHQHHQLQHQLSAPPAAATSSTMTTSKHNLFNIITTANNTNLISSHASSHQLTNSANTSTQRTPSSIPCSSASPTNSSLSSLESSPVNKNQSTGYMSSPSASSIFVPDADTPDHQAHLAKYNVLQQGHHVYSHTDCCASDNQQKTPTTSMHNQVTQLQAAKHIDTLCDFKPNLESLFENCGQVRNSAASVYEPTPAPAAARQHPYHTDTGATNNSSIRLAYSQASTANAHNTHNSSNNNQNANSSGAGSTLSSATNSPIVSLSSSSSSSSSSTSSTCSTSVLMTTSGSSRPVAGGAPRSQKGSDCTVIASGSAAAAAAKSAGIPQKARRCRHITDYVLADEEKRLLVKEGYTDFPMTCQARPLSKNEEKILRKIRRKIRNKKSAQCSRQRKKEYVEDLERKYAAVIRENEQLKQILDKLQQRGQFQSHNNDTGNPILFDWRDLFPASGAKQIAQQASTVANIYN